MAGHKANEGDWEPHQHREAQEQEEHYGEEPDRRREAPEQVRERAAGVEVLKLPAARRPTSVVVLVDCRLPVLEPHPAGPAPVGTAALARHVVATAGLLGHDAAFRAGLGAVHCPALVQPLLSRDLSPVFVAWPAYVRIGVVVAEPSAAVAAGHLGHNAPAVVHGGPTEGAAAGALSDGGVLTHLPETHELRVRRLVCQVQDLFWCRLASAQVASDPVHAAIHDKASDVVAHALAADTVVLRSAVKQDNPLLFPDVLQAEGAAEGPRQGGGNRAHHP
mmetsp:Transcript_282/g.966  ORF Transcript_282/g.966 Transcript_282/m.966 type:complete len:277 (+) Transcript_282:497-1327(+)